MHPNAIRLNCFADKMDLELANGQVLGGERFLDDVYRDEVRRSIISSICL